MNHIIFTELFHGIQLLKFVSEAYNYGFSDIMGLKYCFFHPEELIVTLI